MKKRKKKVISNPVSSIQNHFPKFTITTLGCKVNQSESDAMAHQLKNSGWHPVHPKEKADLCIINTCTVTNQSDQKSRQVINQAANISNKALTVVTGCMATHYKEKLQ